MIPQKRKPLPKRGNSRNHLRNPSLEMKLEIDILKEIIDVLKKDLGIDQKNLTVKRKKTSKYNSYAGEITPAITNEIKRNFLQ